jgi:hypothetical protein
MTHITYQLAVIRRDELLRQAASRRLAARPAVSAPGAVRVTRFFGPTTLRRLGRLGFADRG